MTEATSAPLARLDERSKYLVERIGEVLDLEKANAAAQTEQNERLTRMEVELKQMKESGERRASTLADIEARLQAVEKGEGGRPLFPPDTGPHRELVEAQVEETQGRSRLWKVLAGAFATVSAFLGGWLATKK